MEELNKFQEKKKNSEKFFEERIKPIFNLVGYIGAIVSGLAYLITIVLIVVGFKAHYTSQFMICYGLGNAVFGLLITFFMRYQGQLFARNLPENKEVLKEYYGSKAKKKHNISYYWTIETIKDIIIKGISIVIATYFTMNFIIVATNDYMMFLLGFVSLLMFISFGMIACNNMYDKYNQEHIPLLKEVLKAKIAPRTDESKKVNKVTRKVKNKALKPKNKESVQSKTLSTLKGE